MFEFLKEMWNYKQICYNVITYCIVWSTFAVTYNNVFIKLETVGGNMYFNTILLLIFEMSASFVAGLIIMKFNILKSIKSFMFFEILLGLSFIMAPIQVQKDLPLSQALSLLAILVATKFFSDLVNNLINLYAPKVFTDDFIGMFLIMSRLSSRIFLMVLPSVNFLFESIPLHPFLCLSILWGICRLMTNYTAEIMEEGIEDVLNEFKVDLTTRVSIMQNAEYLDVEDVLSNVVVEDVKLSTIRASRKISSKHINVSRTHSIENNHPTQMELKESLFKKTQTFEN